MDTLPRYLQYGEQVTIDSRSRIFAVDDSLEAMPVFYIIAGLVKLEYRVGSDVLPLYLPPDMLFGLVEPLAECRRLSRAQALERTILYRWDMDGFFTAAGVSWELALAATVGLTRELRILNAEFGERVGAGEKGGS